MTYCSFIKRFEVRARKVDPDIAFLMSDHFKKERRVTAAHEREAAGGLSDILHQQATTIIAYIQCEEWNADYDLIVPS